MSAPTMDTSTTERNRAVIRRLTDAFNDRDKEALLACYSEATVCHYASGPETLSQEEMWSAVLSLYEIMPDLRARIVALIAEDAHVVVRWDFEGTQEGELLGFPPSGRKATWARWFDYRLDDTGRIVEIWWLTDGLSLLQQLGHLELPSETTNSGKGGSVGDGTVNDGWVRDLIARNRYLVLGTADGDQPWVAPIEYLADEDLNLYFFSPEDTRHARHIQANETVAIAVFDQEQPEYRTDGSVTLNGVQMQCTAVRLSQDQYTDDINAGIEALNPPMPPYEVFRITPRRVYVPAIRDGVNVRNEIEMG